jgi:g-D-glutamyl-meso-diaminopimelate peptidase
MTYNELLADILSLDNIPNIERVAVGYSTLGQEILGYHIGNYTGKQILIEGGIHAREYPSTLVVVGIAKYLAEQTTLNGGIYIIPLTNPDGARLVLDGVDWIECQQQRDYILAINSGSTDFSQWKADIWAVDLNINFPALWGGGSQNVFCPSPSNFVGYYPTSEREVRNLIDLTNNIKPDLTLSYHTKGNVIYYGFEVLSPEELARDEEIAGVISQVNGYTQIRTINSTGGYSDWVSLNLRVPAYTIEVGDVSLPTPIPLDVIPDAIDRNKAVPLALLDYLNAV